jgi:hypothetical protein
MDLKNIAQWLRGADESQWEDVNRVLSETISELQALGHPPRSDTKEGRSAESDSFSSQATAINVAMPEPVKTLDAMHGHNRAAALEHGQAALGLLPVE